MVPLVLLKHALLIERLQSSAIEMLAITTDHQTFKLPESH